MPYKTIAVQVQAMSRYHEYTHFALAGIDYGRIGELIGASGHAGARLGLATAALERRNANLLVSLSGSEGSIASAPPFVFELPAAGLFIHARAVRSITPHESTDAKTDQESVATRVEIVDTTVAFLEVMLPQLKPAFLLQYRGAKARAKDRGPDWSTQGGASMRKLLKGVLHTAAPNEIVVPWATRNRKQLDQHGRPTRATKIDWLCEFYPAPEYRSTVKIEMLAALRVIEMLDQSQHVDDTPDFDAQYDEVVLRVEVAIMHVLTIWKARTTH